MGIFFLNRNKPRFIRSAHLFIFVLSTHIKHFLVPKENDCVKNYTRNFALNLSSSGKVDESQWRLSVQGGCCDKAISVDIQNPHPYD